MGVHRHVSFFYSSLSLGGVVSGAGRQAFVFFSSVPVHIIWHLACEPFFSLSFFFISCFLFLSFFLFLGSTRDK